MKKLIYASKVLLVLMAIGTFPSGLFAETIHLNAEATKVRMTENSYQKLVFSSTIADIGTLKVSTAVGDFNVLSVEGFGQRNVVGEPALPVYRKLIEVPLNASFTINIIKQHFTDIDLDDQGIKGFVMPAQHPLSKGDDPSKVTFEYNSQIYSSNDFIDDPFATVTPIGILRALNLARVDISPVQYNPVENILRVYDVLEVEIVFNNANIPGTIGLKQTKASPYFKSMYGMVENFKPLGPGDELISSAPVTYVIISDPMFQSALAPFIQWKQKKGFKVIEGYTNNPLVGNTTTSIKAYLQSLYNTPPSGFNAPSFILFVGDVAQIPAWSGSAGSHVTDLRYCEYTGDNLPEVYYGRFSATTVAELQPQIDKTLEYEKYLMPDPSFLNEAVMVAGADASYQTHSNGQIYYGTENYFNAAHNIVSHTYLQPEPSGGNYSANIKSNVSSGVAYANYTAHCSSSGWADPSFSISDIAGLTNAHKYCLMVGNCCLSAKFDVTSFAEEQLRAANKGSVGYIGGSNNTYWDEDYWWGCGFKTVVLHPSYDANHIGSYDGTFHDHGEPSSDWFITQGQMVVCGNYAVEESNTSRKTYYWEIYHLMGDPSLMIYYSVPPALTATYQNTLMLGMSSLTVTTEANAYVALSFNGTLLDAKLADAAGIANLTFPALGAVGYLDIVITKQNRQPHISTIQAIPASGPYVVYTSNSISDPIPSGNNNNLVDFGETDLMSIAAKNVGVAVASNTIATLSSADTYIVINDNTENFGSINPNQVVNMTDAFSFSVSNNIPDQHIIPFTFSATNGSDTWNSQFNVTANAPNLAIGVLSVHDTGPGCNNDGILDPGETADLYIECNNTGHASLGNIAGTLTISGGSSPDLILNNSTYNIGTITPGGSSSAVFNVTANASTPIGTPVDLLFNLTGGSYSAQEAMQVIIGLIPTYVITNGTITTCPGNFYDSGGLSGEYQSSENFTETFYPSTPGAQIRFEFSAFETESGYDYLRIYDGINTSANLIGTYHGTTGPGVVMATNASGALTFNFTSDGSITKAGWQASISCYNSAQPPVAQFTASATNPAINTTVTLTDQTVNIPTSWSWSISPGTYTYVNSTSSTSQHPQVQFSSIGTYTVSLHVENAYGTDEITKVDYISVITCSYCTTSFSNLTDDFISNVTLSTINNNSGSTSYSDYTSQSATLMPGTSQGISASITVNGAWIQHCIAWIDWNHNCSFTDAGELVDLGQTPGTAGVTVLTGTVNVPVTALPGPTRMRISERYSQDPGSCDAATYGEAEDYTIIVGSSERTVNLSVMLEGLYNGEGTMRKAQNATGDQFTGNTADQITVEIHDATNYSVIVSTINNVNLSTSGLASLTLPGSFNGSYYITVKHRNSLETTTLNPVSFSSGTVNCNLNHPSQVYGANLNQMPDGSWTIFSGDVNQDGAINNDDILLVSSQSSLFTKGYLPEDVNGNAMVDAGDMIIIDNCAAHTIERQIP